MDANDKSALNNLIVKIIQTQPKLIHYDLNRVKLLLSRLGSPQLSVKNIIHVAGTNGKGSTIATLKALLKGHGYSVNSFTSPHLIKPSERININGNDIDDLRLLDLILKIIEVKKEIELSYFEIFACASFLAFQEMGSDFTLMEVGLGGRKDATNIIKDPMATLITPISMDHKEFLGSTISKIANEKAGIIKKNIPVFVGKQKRNVLKVIRSEAEKFSCPLFEHGKHWRVRNFSKKHYVEIQDSLIELETRALKGEYQVENSALALATLHYLKILKNELTEKCLANVIWPGRFQYLEKGPISDISKKINNQNEIVIDGAHNPLASKALAHEIRTREWENTYLILAMQRNKDLGAFMKNFEGLVKNIFIVESKDPIFLKFEEVLTQLSAQNFIIHKSKSIQSSIRLIVNQEKKIAKSIIITGSLYFIGKVLELNTE